MSPSPIQIAANELRSWLLLKLPAKVAEINEERPAKLVAAKAGPYTIASGAAISLGTGRSGPWESPALTAGSRTATQVASDLNAGLTELVASVDSLDRLVITAEPPDAESTTISCVALQADTTANAPFGWAAGGEHVTSAPLRAPTYSGVCDGNPLYPFDNSQGFWVVLDDRECSLWPDVETGRRRNEFLCTFQVFIYRPDINAQPYRSREAISSCARAVREVLQTSEGVQLGRGANGDIVVTDVVSEKISGTPFSFSNSKTPNLAFDVASLVIRIKVYKLPPTSGGN